MPIDQSMDLNGQSIYRITQLYSPPPFVKAASTADICGSDGMSPNSYADVTMRQFPCHTPAATWMSAAFFAENQDQIGPRAPLIAHRIKEAANYFKIAEPIKELQEKVAAANTPEDRLADEDFAFVFSDREGHKERRCPLNTSLNVKAAADWLSQFRDELPYPDRRNTAEKILEAATKYGADVSAHRDMLERMSGLGICSAKHAAAFVRTRIRAAGNTHQPSDVQEQMEKFASHIEREPHSIHHYHILNELATFIDNFDRAIGIKYAGTGFERPEDVLFAVTEKLANDEASTMIGNHLTGNFYKKSDLQRVPVNDLADALGNDFAKAISTANAWIDTEKLARIVPTLPRGDAELFDAVAANAGIEPFAVKTAQDQGLFVTPETQAELAGAHQAAPGSLWNHVR
jgi:hypothetical protein